MSAPGEVGRAERDAITLDDVEFWLSILGESFEQGTNDGADSIRRLEALRSALARAAGA